MTSTLLSTRVSGAEVVEITEVKRTRRVFVFFTTEWWEVVSTRHIRNDIHITTNCPIANVYINGNQI